MGMGHTHVYYSKDTMALGDILFFYNIIIVYKLKSVIYSDHFTAFN
jgi:hypothetical protein